MENKDKSIKKSDKQKLLEILEMVDDSFSFETIIHYYLVANYNDFNASRIYNMTHNLNTDFLKSEIDSLETGKSVALMRANFLKTYLEGKMFTSKEAAEENVQAQIDNAQAIIDSYKK